MPTWSEILSELMVSGQGGPPQLDLVRRKYIVRLHQLTSRNVILYASKWTQPGAGIAPELLSICEEDLQGLMEVTHGLSGPNLDLILHSPGGSAEAAEALVQYLRSKFSHIRVVVPQSAMSAATMMACAADVILMGKHSFLGPIDPQLFINTSLGGRMVAAQAILEQFSRAKSECTQPENMGAWLPMLSQYGPDLLVTCKNACDLSRDLVQGWLEKYMFSTDPGRVDKATRLAEWLSTHSNFKSHGRHIARTEARNQGLNIEDLEANQNIQDAVLSVFHATTHTFGMTGAVKIIENQLGKAFIKAAQVFLPAPPVPPVPQPPAPP